MNDNIAIKAQCINKYFRNYHALTDVSLNINEGDIYGFIGKNGAGKTTFMRILGGLIKPDSGSIEIIPNIAGISAINHGE